MIDEAAVAEMTKMIRATGFTVAEFQRALEEMAATLSDTVWRLGIGDAMAWSPPADDEDWWTP